MSGGNDPIRIGVVGYGFGQHHVRTLVGHEDFALVAVADRSASGLNAAAARHGFKAYGDGEAMIREAELDAVSIATSPKSRRALLSATIERDLPAFVEKPWASDAAHARELADLCKPARAPVMTGFSFRFHAAVTQLQTLLDEQLGTPRQLHGQYAFGWLPPAEHWAWDPANGNGFFNENSCHLFDVVCTLMGQPTRVFAETGRFTGRPKDDAASITIRFASGGIASLCCGGLGIGAFQDFPRLTLFAERGQAELIGAGHVWNTLRWATANDPTVRQFEASPEQLGSTRYTAAFDRFASCVRDQTPPPATIGDGVLAVELAMATARSAQTERPVDLPL